MGLVVERMFSSMKFAIEPFLGEKWGALTKNQYQEKLLQIDIRKNGVRLNSYSYFNCLGSISILFPLAIKFR